MRAELSKLASLWPVWLASALAVLAPSGSPCSTGAFPAPTGATRSWRSG